MSELREKIADAIAGAVSQDDRYLEHADAVLRVLAEHGGATNLREQISLMVWRSANKRAERAEADLAAARQQLDQVRASRDLARDDVLESLAVAERRAEVAEQRLAAVRDVAEEFSDSPTPWPHVADRILDALDAPARPAGHGESGQ
jgi:hypothetical protein